MAANSSSLSAKPYRSSAGARASAFKSWAGLLLRRRISFSSMSRPMVMLRARSSFLITAGSCRGPGGLDELEPVPAGDLAGRGDDLDDVAVLQLRAQGNEATVDLGARAVETHVGVDGEGENRPGWPPEERPGRRLAA